jgi:hypothetical protein
VTAIRWMPQTVADLVAIRGFENSPTGGLHWTEFAAVWRGCLLRSRGRSPMPSSGQRPRRYSCTSKARANPLTLNFPSAGRTANRNSKTMPSPFR